MEFDKSRVYSAVNADELKPGDKVIAAHQLGNLKYQVSQKDYYVQQDYNVWTIKEIKEDTYSDRFVTVNGAFPLVYLVERKDNCTNCGEGKWDAEHKKILCDPVNCGKGNVVFRNHEIEVCEYWKPKTKQKAEKDCDNCGQRCDGYGKGEVCSQWKPKVEHKCEECRKVYTDYPCVANVYHDATGRACKNFEAEKHADYNHCEEARKSCAMTNACPEKHYRPFRDVDELIKVWEEKTCATPYWGKGADLVMPHIWVKKRHDDTDRGTLIISFSNNGCSVIDVDEIEVLLLEDLFNIYTFLDGSPCGIEV